MSGSLNNPPVFSQASACPMINGNVELLTNTWEMHIKQRHPEVAGAIDQIRTTIANPAYAARSLPGPNQTHGNNVVLISDDAKIRTSHLHVFVESPAYQPKVSTTMYLKRRHGDVLWRDPDKLQVSYDENADVLYISKASPVPALTEESGEGIFLRFSIEDDSPCGVTVTSFHEVWADHLEDLAKRISAFLKVPGEETTKVLREKS